MHAPAHPHSSTRRLMITSPPPSRLHIVFTLLLVKFALLLCCCILVLLVLRHQIIHVALGLREFHLIHSFTCVPMQEGFAAEHSCEVLCNSFEHLLNCG